MPHGEARRRLSEVTKHSISVPRSARYFVEGDPAGAAEAWFVLHGYGELAAEFLEGFAELFAPERVFVAPEGLSRFYRSRGTGPVGASWMTKVAREDEIADTVRYLDAVYGTVFAGLDPAARVHVLGFSQGAASAFRWAALGLSRADRLTLWGEGVPSDVDLEKHRARLERVEIALVSGRSDEFHDERKLEADVERLRAAGLVHRVIRFDGGHEIDQATLRGLAR